MRITEIYLDADGVLADFDKLACTLLGVASLSEAKKSQMWASIHKYERSGGRFWYDLEYMPDAEDLILFVTNLSRTMGIKVEILTAAGDVHSAPQQKIDWFKERLPHIKVNIVHKSSDKAEFASPTSVLVDDRDKSILPWEQAGGIGILYTSAQSTIEKLTELLNLPQVNPAQ